MEILSYFSLVRARKKDIIYKNHFPGLGIAVLTLAIENCYYRHKDSRAARAATVIHHSGNTGMIKVSMGQT